MEDTLFHCTVEQREADPHSAEGGHSLDLTKEIRELLQRPQVYGYAQRRWRDEDLSLFCGD